MKRYLILAIFLLSGCTSTGFLATKPYTDSNPTKENSGLIVVGLQQSNWNLYKSPMEEYYIWFYQAKGYALGKNFYFKGGAEYKGDIQYVVLNLPSREYLTNNLAVGSNNYRFKDTHFFVKPDTITYLGNIDVSLERYGFTADVVVRDNIEDAMLFLESNYPKAASKYSLAKDILSITAK